MILPMNASQREGLYSTPSRSGPEAATQTFLRGAVLVAASGNLSEGGANPSPIVGVAEEDGDNLGIALGNVRYNPAYQGIVFEGTLNDGNADYVSLVADLFVEFGITKDGTTNNWFVDKSKTGANGRVRVIEFVDPVGTADARVRFIFTMDNSLTGIS